MAKFAPGIKFDINLLQEQIKKEFLLLIDNCESNKAILWDEGLPPIWVLVKDDILREHGVKKPYRLEPGPLPPERNIIFFTRPLPHLMDLIASKIHKEERTLEKKKYYLIFVPAVSLYCEERLKSKGVYGNFNNSIFHFPFNIYPFDSDLLSMEMGSAFKKFYVEKDPTGVYAAGEALHRLESVYGRARVVGKGTAAQGVARVAQRLSAAAPPPISRHIDTVLLLDRTTDLVSALATQLTYLGLIDELFGVKNTTVTLPAEKFSSSDEMRNYVSEEVKFILNSTDSIFSEIRDKNFNGVGAVLNKKANEISNQFNEKPHSDQSVQHIKQFVAKLPNMMADRKSLSIHTTIAELIKEVTDSTDFLTSLQLEQELMLGVDTDKIQTHIEDLVAHQAPLIKVLRLMCLQSATNSGLKPKVMEHYVREIVQTYGFKHIISLSQLEKAGLLKIQGSGRSYTVMRKTLKLTVVDGCESQPQDAHFVHSVYAPVCTRLAVAASRPTGWQALGDVLDQLPGPQFDFPVVSHDPSSRRDSIGSEASQTDRTKVVLVFFIGGCTFAEVAALRFLSRKEDSNVEYIIATTKLMSGNAFITSLMEDLEQ